MPEPLRAVLPGPLAAESLLLEVELGALAAAALCARAGKQHIAEKISIKSREARRQKQTGTEDTDPRFHFENRYGALVLHYTDHLCPPQLASAGAML
jgi:hypothetical protein